MKEIKEMSIGELAAYVSTWLQKKGISCILTGGACVSIYTLNKYISYDIDLIEQNYVSRTEIKQALADIGFEERNRYFVHPKSDLFIEFPTGPVSIGNEPISKFNQLELPTGHLVLLSPTDCVKDRLAAYYHWDDLQALGQAIMVANDNKIDLKEIERWSKTEGKLKEFLTIREKFTGKQ